MERQFHFRSALVVREKDFVRVRFWARESDQIECVPVFPPTHYEPNADIILLIEGGPGKPEFPHLEEGPQLFEGPSIEVLFRGACTATVDDYGLHVYVPSCNVIPIRTVGLPFPNTDWLDAGTFNLLGDIALEDFPPHDPPP